MDPKENDVTVVNSASCVTSSSTNSSSLTANSSDAVEVDENGTNKYFVSHCLVYTIYWVIFLNFPNGLRP